jgi:hypothetical protein
MLSPNNVENGTSAAREATRSDPEDAVVQEALATRNSKLKTQNWYATLATKPFARRTRRPSDSDRAS